MGERWNRWIGALGRFMCYRLHWHRTGSPMGYDGASMHSMCIRCGYVGMIDSQGNLF